MASHTVLWPHNHCVPSQPLWLALHSVYLRHYTQYTNFMKSSECMLSHHDSIYDIKHSMFMTYSFIWHHAQCYDHTTIVCLHSHYAWHYAQCILDITHNVPILWKEVDVCHQSIYIYDTICTTYDILSTLYDITPLYLWCHFYYI